MVLLFQFGEIFSQKILIRIWWSNEKWNCFVQESLGAVNVPLTYLANLIHQNDQKYYNNRCEAALLSQIFYRWLHGKHLIQIISLPHDDFEAMTSCSILFSCLKGDVIPVGRDVKAIHLSTFAQRDLWYEHDMFFLFFFHVLGQHGSVEGACVS